jgi:hypothetical protein
VRRACFSGWLEERDHLCEQFAAADIMLEEIRCTVGRQSVSAVLFQFQIQIKLALN